MKVASIPEQLGRWVAAGSPVADWQELIADGDALVRLRVALNSHAPEEITDHLSQDSAWFVRWAAARRPGVDLVKREEVLMSLVSHEQVGIRMLAAVDPVTPDEALSLLAVDHDERVRSLVRENPAASDDVRAAASILRARRPGERIRRPKPDANRDLDEDILGIWASTMRAAGDSSTAAPGSLDNERVWAVGEMGPGGGVVFFDAGARQWWGQYLEAAPAGWQYSRNQGVEDPLVVWSSEDFVQLVEGASEPMTGALAELFPGLRKQYTLATGTALGWGSWNSWRIVQHAGPLSAAWLAATYPGGGYVDWFLPSEAELKSLRHQRRLVGAMESRPFWSSSQIDDGGIFASACDFEKKRGTEFCDFRLALSIRPIRSF